MIYESLHTVTNIRLMLPDETIDGIRESDNRDCE